MNNIANMMRLHHTHDHDHDHDHHLSTNQCSSTLVQTIKAPLPLVWSIVRNFEEPQAYKSFIRSSCTMRVGDDARHGGPGEGSIRQVTIASGLPAATSIERLDRLDDNLHVMRFSIIGGDHRLVNYRSTISLHDQDDGDDHNNSEGKKRTVVVESYVVDVPDGNSKEETCFFTNTVIGINLRSLANIAENLA